MNNTQTAIGRSHWEDESLADPRSELTVSASLAPVPSPGARPELATFLTTSGPFFGAERQDVAGLGRILVLLSNPEIGAVVACCLSAAGFVVSAKSNWTAGIADAKRFNPDVVLLDSHAPDFPGTKLIRCLREGEPEGHRAAIITLIRSERDIDPTFGLDLYPCDFLLIPIHVRELALRIDEIVRTRRGRKVGPHPEIRRQYVVGPLELDVDGHSVKVHGEEIHFSTIEMRLLTYLVEHKGRVRTRKQLLEEVWGYNANVSTRTPDTHVNRLRMKLGAAGDLVETIRGTGYRLSSAYPVIVKD